MLYPIELRALDYFVIFIIAIIPMRRRQQR